MEPSTKNPRNGERDYLGVARTLQYKLDGLVASGAMDFEAQREILFNVSQELDLLLANNKATHQHNKISTYTSSCNQQFLNPALWSMLPMELLQCVFAKLPIPNICYLKSLSKEWKMSLESSSSEFTFALKESFPKLLARVTLEARGGYSNFGLHVLDERNNRWHESHVNAVDGPSNDKPMVSKVYNWVHMNGAADAGLVCYVDKRSRGLNCIFVINPMTGVFTELPILNSLAYSELSMMRIFVDRNTYHYKVIVVKRDQPVEVEVYDSKVQQWTKPKPSLGCIFGIAHNWFQHRGLWSAYKLGPCAYDCRNGKYYDFRQDYDKWLGNEVISYTLMEDRLFVLYQDERKGTTFISEYCVPKNTTSWVKKNTHKCFPLVCRIHACSGFLYVFVPLRNMGGEVSNSDPYEKHEYESYVYNLATSQWHALPPVPSWCIIQSKCYLSNYLLCELHWNIQP